MKLPKIEVSDDVEDSLVQIAIKLGITFEGVRRAAYKYYIATMKERLRYKKVIP
jgi:hypothetical protein